MASAESLRGYILEEVLAYLIRNTGYSLLVSESQDRENLAKRGNGLVVLGRGGEHQADVLGELNWIPAFTYPIRLFVEAKFRSNRLYIDAVRNAVGVLLDINQKYFKRNKDRGPHQIYKYEYALFSTSGFSKGAQNMALAHQISLVDLGIEEFRPLLDSIEQAAGILVRADIDGGYRLVGKKKGSKEVLHMRNYLRDKLGTWPEGVEGNGFGYLKDGLEPLEPVIQNAIELEELFIAIVNGPYILVLKADSRERFLRYSREHPRHRVTISWSYKNNKGRVWNIRPADVDDIDDMYVLSFSVPDVLYKWIFETNTDARSRAMNLKESHMSSITIYRFDRDGRDQIIRLNFDKEATKRRARHVERKV